jgi:hypothetical protein
VIASPNQTRPLRIFDKNALKQGNTKHEHKASRFQSIFARMNTSTKSTSTAVDLPSDKKRKY